MLLFGCLALFQMAFLPGFLILAYGRLNQSVCQTLFLSFMLSLVVNFFLVLGLVLLQSYSLVAVYLVFFLEVLLLWQWLRRSGGMMSETSKKGGENISEAQYLAVLAVLLIGCVFFIYYQKNITQKMLFAVPDAIFRWNTWAIQWANNHFPVQTWLYPPLLPANWSLTYKFTYSTVVQVFATISVLFFPIALVLGFLDLFFRERKVYFIYGLTVTAFLLFGWLGRSIYFGYADLPCAVMGFSVIYLIMLAKKAKSIEVLKKYYFLGCVLSAGAALTKQAGVFLALIYPALSYFILLASTPNLSGRVKRKWVLIGYLIIAAMVVPIYGYNFVRILQGTNSKLAEGLFAEQYYLLPFLKRLYYALNELWVGIGLWALIASFGCVLVAAWKQTFWRWLTLAVVLPYFILWSLFVAYDVRNFTFIVPCLGLLIGYGLCELIQMSADYFKTRKDWLVSIVIFVVAAVLIGLSFKYTEEVLVNKTLFERLNVDGAPDLTKQIYRYFAKYPKDQGSILTNYAFLAYLPGFEQRGITTEFTRVSSSTDQFKKTRPAYVFVYKPIVADYLYQTSTKRLMVYRQIIGLIDGFPIHPVNPSKELKKQPVNRFILRDMLQKSGIRFGYKVIIDTPSVLFIKINYLDRVKAK